jgi:hypothetical protein
MTMKFIMVVMVVVVDGDDAGGAWNGREAGT